MAHGMDSYYKEREKKKKGAMVKEARVEKIDNGFLVRCTRYTDGEYMGSDKAYFAKDLSAAVKYLEMKFKSKGKADGNRSDVPEAY